jgi:hypothetical protein
MVDEKVLPQLEALEIDPARALLVVDVDEVLVGLAAHLGEFAAENGFALKLTGYKLDGALKRSDGETASPEEFRALFTDFFETQTLHQRVYSDAANVLKILSSRVQVIILTNVPPYAEEDRIENLRGHGIEYPLVVNYGGKGRALAWLNARTSGPVAFIDDSPTQIASAAKHAPDVVRLHFVGDDHLRGLLGPLPDAHHAPRTWVEIGEILNQSFAPASSRV